MNVATPFDDLAITTIMSPVIAVTGSVALALWVLFVICETFRLQYEGVRAAVDSGGGEAPKYGPFFLRAFTILTTLTFLYNWTFLKMVSLCDHVFMLINNEQNWLSLLSQLTTADTSVHILNTNIPTLMGAAAISVLQVVQDLFFAFRFVVLAVLYVSGPIVWAFGVSSIGVRSIKGWFKNTWQVCFWIVVFGIVKAAVVPLGLYALSNSTTGTVTDAATGAAAGLVYAIVIIMMITMIPKLTGALFSDEHISAVGGAIAGAAVAYYASSHSQVLSSAQRGLGGTVDKQGNPVGALPAAAHRIGSGVGAIAAKLGYGSGKASAPPSSSPNDAGSDASPRADHD
jgi:hypothetical protein